MPSVAEWSSAWSRWNFLGGWVGLGACALLALGGCRTAAVNDLWKHAPDSTEDGGQGGGDRAIPGGGFDLPPSCKVDPAKVAPMAMVDVPAGPFAMGCAPGDTECKDDENPQHTVTLSAFSIDKTEVTQAEYALCYQSGKCQKPYCKWDPCAQPNLPIACVWYQEASDYCVYAGKRLPTEAQWEKAARGTDARIYPWGNDPPDCTKANMTGCGGLKDVGQLAAGASPFGALDMAGNVVEWVADVYSPDYYRVSPPNDPPGPSVPPPPAEVRYGGRGGGWHSVAFWQRTSTRDLYEVDYVKDSLGFRCVK